MIQLAPLSDFLRRLRREPTLRELASTLLPLLVQWHPLLAGHAARVARCAQRLASASGTWPIPPDLALQTALLHDLGKLFFNPRLAVPCSAASHRVPALFQEHPVIGYRLLRTTLIQPAVCAGVLHHHEHWDGSGYPMRLAGGDIPRLARLVALADTFDALTSPPPLGRGLDRKAALEELARLAGRRLDPDLVAATLPLLAERETHPQEIDTCSV